MAAMGLTFLNLSRSVVASPSNDWSKSAVISATYLQVDAGSRIMPELDALAAAGWQFAIRLVEGLQPYDYPDDAIVQERKRVAIATGEFLSTALVT